MINHAEKALVWSWEIHIYILLSVLNKSITSLVCSLICICILKRFFLFLYPIKLLLFPHVSYEYYSHTKLKRAGNLTLVVHAIPLVYLCTIGNRQNRFAHILGRKSLFTGALNLLARMLLYAIKNDQCLIREFKQPWISVIQIIR